MYFYQDWVIETSEDMKTLFGHMIIKNSKRVSRALSNIKLNKEDHKISNCSKAEFKVLPEH